MTPKPKSGTSAINPLVDSILSKPLSFIQGKHIEPKSEKIQNSYIVLKEHTRSEKPGTYKEVHISEMANNTREDRPSKETKRPKTMAEAVAVYTGRKFLTKAERRAAKRKKPSNNLSLKSSTEKEDGEEIREQINAPKNIKLNNSNIAGSESDSMSDSQFESASEYPSESHEGIFDLTKSKLPIKNKLAHKKKTGRVGNDSAEDIGESDIESPSNSDNTISASKTATSFGFHSSENDSDDVDDEDADFQEHESDESENYSNEESDVQETSLEDDADLGKDLKKDMYEQDKSEISEKHEMTQTEEEVTEKREDSDHIVPKNYVQKIAKSDKVTSASETPSDAKNNSSSTPPTSPDQAGDKVKTNSPNTSLQNLQSFYKFDEASLPSSNSGRINRSWNGFKKSKPAGLLNHGVTCYMNSAIQSMIHIPSLQHYLNDINKGKYNDVLKPRSVSHVLAELSAKMWGISDSQKHKASKYINPKKIISRLSDINCMMSIWQQEDSHEYFMSLLSRLQEDSTPKGQKLNSSIIYDIFGGLLHQQVTCNKCGNISNTKQEFYDLSLGFNKRRNSITNDISQLSKYSILRSIKDYFSNELIKIDKGDSSSGYFCEKCKENTNANKLSVIDKAPETLIVHLKRFKFDGNSSSKMKQAISYPQFLDMTDYTATKTPTMYQLISVIVHEGRSISSGHYVAHCLQPDGSWSTYDDEYINRINEKEAFNDASAYVLVYSKLLSKGIKRKSSSSPKPKSKKSKKI